MNLHFGALDMLGATLALLRDPRPSLTRARAGSVPPARLRRFGLSAGCAALTVLCGTASAQTTYGLIEGRITDAAGGVLPGATITITQPATGFARTVASNELGLYRMLYVSPAEYTLTVERSGFARVTRGLVKVDVGQTVTLNVTMTVDSVVVAVNVAPAAASRTSPEISSTIDTRRVSDLPLNGRDFTRLTLFAPGVVQTSSLIASLSANAGNVSQNNFLLDGIDATRIDDSYPSNGYERGSRLQTASVESIEEIRVLTSNYSAEYGRAAGAVVSAVTKSGINTFHGSGYGFFRNQRFDARNFFDGPEKPAFDMKQAGGSLSGPIRRDGVFFFNSYEGSRKDLGASASGTVPSSALRARVDPALAPILASIPFPTQATSNSDIGLVQYADNTKISENIYSARVDARVSGGDSFFSRYNVQDSLVTGPQYVVFAAALSGQQQYVPIRTQSFIASYVRVLRSNLMNETKFGINRFAGRLGELDPGSPEPIPQTTITGVNVVPGLRAETSQHSTSFEYIDNLSWFRGAHAVKAGVNIRRVWHNVDSTGTTALVFPSLADLAENRPSQATFAPPLATASIRGWTYSGYLQDDWRAAARLTLNAGLRYDYTPPYTDVEGRVRNFDVRTMQLTAPGAALYQPDRDNLAPRLGFTYDLRGDGRSILRGGFGYYYGLYPPVSAESLLTANAPGTTLLTRTEDPLLRYPLASLAAGRSNPPTRRAIDPHRKDSYSRQATVTLQQQLGTSTTVTAGYVGSRSRRNERARPLNLIDPATGERPDARFSQILFAESSGSATYDALQLALARRFSNGFALSANYAYSRLMDDIVSPQNPFVSWDLEWARGNREIPHNLSVSALYELPFGPGHRWGDGGALARVLGGWQVNGIVLARSGQPYTVTLGAVTRSGTGWTTNQRPDVVSGVAHAGVINGPAGWLNPAAFSNPAAGTFGDLGRNTERGPHFLQVDASLLKNVPLGDTRRVQLRFEIYNILNRLQLPSAPNANFLAPGTFGRFFNAFGRTEGFGTSRQIQFAVRYVF
jgi:outer membrane receptor protein involved in Fe transport